MDDGGVEVEKFESDGTDLGRARVTRTPGYAGLTGQVPLAGRDPLGMETEPVEKRTYSGPIAVYLTPDEAPVLDAFLSRGQAAGNQYGIEDQAELRVLWDLSAIFESWLTQPLLPDYDHHLAEARAAVRDSTG
jgi:hypothetical protein